MSFKKMFEKNPRILTALEIFYCSKVFALMTVEGQKKWLQKDRKKTALSESSLDNPCNLPGSGV